MVRKVLSETLNPDVNDKKEPAMWRSEGRLFWANNNNTTNAKALRQKWIWCLWGNERTVWLRLKQSVKRWGQRKAGAWSCRAYARPWEGVWILFWMHLKAIWILLSRGAMRSGLPFKKIIPNPATRPCPNSEVWVRKCTHTLSLKSIILPVT